MSLHQKHVSLSYVIAHLMLLSEQAIDDIGATYHTAFRTLACMACDVYEETEQMKAMINEAVTEGMADYRKEQEKADEELTHEEESDDN